MNKERLFKILRAPHVSEKTTLISSQSNQYAFRVASDASKAEVKAAVEMLFEVKVEGVRVLNVKGKRKAFRSVQGRRPGWKKAYVRIAEGQSIDVLGGE